MTLESDRPVLVAGAGGFIGGHLVRDLVAEGHAVRAVDCKPTGDWYQVTPGAAGPRHRRRRVTDRHATGAVER